MMLESESMKVLVAWPPLTLWDPTDGSPPGSSVHGILQARILQWGAIPFQGIFPTQGLNPGLLPRRQILYHLSHEGSSYDAWLQSRPSLPETFSKSLLLPLGRKGKSCSEDLRGSREAGCWPSVGPAVPRWAQKLWVRSWTCGSAINTEAMARIQSQGSWETGLSCWGGSTSEVQLTGVTLQTLLPWEWGEAIWATN